jgi:hypothetical protein
MKARPGAERCFCVAIIGYFLFHDKQRVRIRALHATSPVSRTANEPGRRGA